MSDDQPADERPFLVPPAWLLIFAGMQYLAGRTVPGLSFPFPFAEIVAGCLAVAGLAFAVVALGLFRRARTTFHPEVPGRTTALVTTGVYGITRNPMYVGMALILAALAVATGSIIAALLVFVFVGVLTAVQIIPEERALERIFGNEYLVYKHRVPRWLFF